MPNDTLKTSIKTAATCAQAHGLSSREALAGTLARVDARARRRRVSSAAFAGVLSVTVLGLLAWTLRDFGVEVESHTPAGAIAASLQVTLVNSAHIATEGSLSSIVTTDDGVWVSSTDPTPRLLKIDPDTLEVVGEVSLTSVPSFVSGGGGLAYFDGLVWVAGLDSTGANLIGIDPKAQTVAQRISLPGYIGLDVVADGDSMLALTSDGAFAAHVVRIGADHQLGDAMQLRDLQPRGLLLAEGSPWVWGLDRGDVTTLVRLNLGSGTAVTFPSTPQNATEFTSVQNRIVVLSSGGVTSFAPDGTDARTRLPGRELRPPLSGDQTNAGVWVAVESPSGRGLTLFPISGGAASQPVSLAGLTPIATASSADTTWALSFEGVIVELKVEELS